MKENLLHFIWQNKLFNMRGLCTSSGMPLQIIDAGRYHCNGGPDFQQASIRIEDVILVGNIELHVRASDWYQHGHELDRKYRNVILHVVYFNDVATGLPTLELNGRILPSLLERYESMMLSKDVLICRPMLKSLDVITLEKWKERLLVERLERKAMLVRADLLACRNDWEQVCYRMFAKYFGGPVNGEVFEQLTRLLPLRILFKHKHDRLQAEALLFGTAGLLDADLEETYPQQLQQEYRFLRHKYQLRSLDAQQWQFLRMRPLSFPTIRLAWLAGLCAQMPFFSKLIAMDDAVEIVKEIRMDSYWETHYVMGKPSKHKSKLPGAEFRSAIAINVLAPLLYAYGSYTGEMDHIEKALSLLERTTAEDNHKTRPFREEVWACRNAYHSQALIELHDHYCRGKRCLDCAVGHRILKGG